MLVLKFHAVLCRAGAEATARSLTLPQAPVRRSPSPGILAVPPTAAAGVAPKDATERRAMQSGASFVTGGFHKSLAHSCCCVQRWWLVAIPAMRSKSHL